MRRVVLHIGPHKTGTTYLQRVFQALRPALAADGIAFPAGWSQSDDQPGHVKLYEALNAGDVANPKTAFDAIAADDVLISAEDLSYLHESQLVQLRTVLGDAAVRVVFYSRRWSEILPSVWQERIKHGFSETLTQFLTAATRNPGGLDFIDSGRILDRYATVFGRENIRIVSYSALTDTGTDIAEHFLSSFLPRLRTPATQAGAVLGSRPNRSLLPAEIEVVRALNAMHIAAGGTPGVAIRHWFLREGHRHGAAALLAAVGRTVQAVRLADARPELDALHRRLWASYGDARVPPGPADGFFVPLVRDIPCAPPMPPPTALYQAFQASIA